MLYSRPSASTTLSVFRFLSMCVNRCPMGRVLISEISLEKNDTPLPYSLRWLFFFKNVDLYTSLADTRYATTPDDWLKMLRSEGRRHDVLIPIQPNINSNRIGNRHFRSGHILYIPRKTIEWFVCSIVLGCANLVIFIWVMWMLFGQE